MKKKQFGRERKPNQVQKSVVNDRFVYVTFTQSRIGLNDKPLRRNNLSSL